MQLNLDLAEKMAKAACEKAKEIGISVTVQCSRPIWKTNFNNAGRKAKIQALLRSQFI